MQQAAPCRALPRPVTLTIRRVTECDTRRGACRGVLLTFDVDLTELDILAEILGLARVVYPYEIPYVGESGAERARHREQVYQRLRKDGFFSRSGNLRGDIEDLLRVWAEPEVVITQVVNEVEGDRRYLYRGGWRGRTGVLTSQEGGVLAFGELRPAQVIDEMVGFLPHVDPVYGAPVIFVQGGDNPPGRREDVDGDVFGGIEAPGPASSNGRKAAEWFFRAPVVRAGIITCSCRRPGTRTSRGREVEVASLTWYDTTDGRFFLSTETLPDGAERCTITPADRARIAHWLRERVNRERSGY